MVLGAGDPLTPGLVLNRPCGWEIPRGEGCTYNRNPIRRLFRDFVAPLSLEIRCRNRRNYNKKSVENQPWRRHFCRGSPWISMDIPMDIDGYPWRSSVSMDIQRYPHGYPWISLHGFPWISWILLISMDTPGYPLTSMDIDWYPWISMDIHGFEGLVD